MKAGIQLTCFGDWSQSGASSPRSAVSPVSVRKLPNGPKSGLSTSMKKWIRISFKYNNIYIYQLENPTIETNSFCVTGHTSDLRTCLCQGSWWCPSLRGKETHNGLKPDLYRQMFSEWASAFVLLLQFYCHAYAADAVTISGGPIYRIKVEWIMN